MGSIVPGSTEYDARLVGSSWEVEERGRKIEPSLKGSMKKKKIMK